MIFNWFLKNNKIQKKKIENPIAHGHLKQQQQ